MPIYEFYCPDCHTIFNFLSRTVDPARAPGCPRCPRTRLERKVSTFAISAGRPEPSADGPSPDLDESRMEQAVMQMADEAEGLDEENPRQMAHLMRRLMDTSGMQLGPGMEEALRRMEAGEDPERIEQEMGDLLADEEPSPESGGGLRSLPRQLRPPGVDETLYEM